MVKLDLKTKSKYIINVDGEDVVFVKGVSTYLGDKSSIYKKLKESGRIEFFKVDSNCSASVISANYKEKPLADLKAYLASLDELTPELKKTRDREVLINAIDNQIKRGAIKVSLTIDSSKNADSEKFKLVRKEMDELKKTNKELSEKLTAINDMVKKGQLVPAKPKATGNQTGKNE